MSEPKRYEVTESYGLGDMREDAQGNYVHYEDYASLKAKVERLEKEVWRMKVFKGIDEDTKATLKDALHTIPEWAKVLETIEKNAQLEADKLELKAEVERLTKKEQAFKEAIAVKIATLIEAGDTMVDYLFATPQTPTCYAYIMDWRNAKNGGQSSSEKAPSFIEDLGNGVERHDLKFRVPSSAKKGGQS